MSKTLGLIFPLIIIAILAIAAYQTINGDFLLGAKAGDPCSSYTRQKPLGTASGIVASKQDGQFIWNLNGDSTKPKVVVLCARTKITKKLGWQPKRNIFDYIKEKKEECLKKMV